MLFNVYISNLPGGGKGGVREGKGESETELKASMKESLISRKFFAD